MKELFFIPVIGLVVLLSGCTQDQEPTMTCGDYCVDQEHVECIGEWNISGDYPDCNCSWICDTVPEPTCQEYCQDQPHIMCVGEWNISGDYPNCVCGWVCDVVVPEKIELIAYNSDGLCAYHEFDMDVGDEEEFYVNDRKHTVKVTKVSSGDLTTVFIDNFFKQFTPSYKFDTLSSVGVYVKEVSYVQGGTSSAIVWVGEHKVNSPDDCFGIE